MIKKIKELRKLTGCSIKMCRESLLESDLNIDKAIIKLREKGLAKKESEILLRSEPMLHVMLVMMKMLKTIKVYII